jgi:hypothetical protein
METDVIELVDTLPVILNNSSSTVGIAVTVQQVASGIGDASSGLDGFSLDACERDFLGLSGFGSGGFLVESGVGGIKGS